MNKQAGTALNDKLVPFLNTLPAQASEMITKFKEMIATNPEGLLQSLFSPEALKQLPAALAEKDDSYLKKNIINGLSPQRIPSGISYYCYRGSIHAPSAAH
ncbi:hypothetical protein GCM10020331_042230 [Ectobacillus funiculus]